MFGPQKGADAAMVERLTARLDEQARRLPARPARRADDGRRRRAVRRAVGRARRVLEPGAPWVLDALDFDRGCATPARSSPGEGKLDEQTLEGKLVGEIGTRARQAGRAAARHRRHRPAGPVRQAHHRPPAHDRGDDIEELEAAGRGARHRARRGSRLVTRAGRTGTHRDAATPTPGAADAREPARHRRRRGLVRDRRGGAARARRLPHHAADAHARAVPALEADRENKALPGGRRAAARPADRARLRGTRRAPTTCSSASPRAGSTR